MNQEKIERFDANEFKSNADGLRGSGGFGEVFLCKHQKLGFVAVKCFRNVYNLDPKKVYREVDLLWNADHDNVVKTHGYVECRDFYGIVMEYAPCKDLQSLIIGRKDDISYSHQLSLKILKEITDGMLYLHTLDKPLVHGDLKPDNILLSNGLHVKIADLGSARHTSTISLKSKKDFGTPGYIAPERYSSEDTKLTSSADIFSFAVIAFQLITREEIFGDQRQAALAAVLVDQHHARHAAKKRADILDGMVKEESDTESKVLLLRLNDMIKSCWDDDPDKRWKTIKIQEKLNLWTDIKLEKKVAEEAAGIAEKQKYPTFNEGSGDILLENCFYLTRNINESCMIVSGGQATKQDVIAFSSKEYIPLPPLSEGRCHHCSVVIETAKNNDKENETQSMLYVMGGVDKGKVLKSVEYLELKQKFAKLDPWKHAKDMHECRFLACADTLNDKIYVVGGKNEKDEVLDTIECFSILNDQWSLVSAVTLFKKRYDFNTFLHNDFIYCCGGLDSNGKVVHILEKFNPETNQQEKLERKPGENKFTRYSACAVKTDEGTVWFIGGLNNRHKAAEPSVVSYKVNDSWQSTKKPIVTKRSSFAAAMTDRTIYVLGGHGLNDKNNSLKTYEQIDLSNKSQWLLSNFSDLNSNASEKIWAGHSMVVWKP